MAKSYENLVFEREVSLAIENFLVGPYPTTWAATPVADVFQPPTGFTWLGAVVEDSPNVTVTREKFQLQTGVPRVIQFEAVTNLTARLEAQLYSHSPRKVQYALGNVVAHNIFTSVDSFTNIASVTNKFQFTLGSTPGNPWAVGDYVVTNTVDASMTLSQNEAQITSITAATSTNGFGAVVLFGTPGFPTTPVPNDDAVRVAGVKSPLGTLLLRQYTVLGVAEFIDGVQVVHKMDKMAPAGEWSEQMRPDDVGKLPIAFDAFGITNSDYGSSQLIVGERFWFPKNA